MATSRTAAMTDEQDRQSLASAADWIAALRQFWREVAELESLLADAH